MSAVIGVQHIEVANLGPVLNINDHATGGRRTKDILGGPKGWGPKKKVANIEIYVIFEVFAFCGRRTKTDFKDRAPALPYSQPEKKRPLLFGYILSVKSQNWCRMRIRLSFRIFFNGKGHKT